MCAEAKMVAEREEVMSDDDNKKAVVDGHRDMIEALVELQTRYGIKVALHYGFGNMQGLFRAWRSVRRSMTPELFREEVLKNVERALEAAERFRETDSKSEALEEKSSMSVAVRLPRDLN